MDVEAADLNAGRTGVEVFIDDLALRPAVHGVGKSRAEALYVEIRRAAAHFLVRREADGDGPVPFAGGDEPLQQRHDLGDAGLVVRAQQRVAAGDDERAPGKRGQVGEVLDAQGAAVAQIHIAAVVIFDQPRMYALSGEVGRGVHMRDEAQAGRVLVPGGGGQVAVDVAGV